jgi:drug/metabolite transporter (DMT)-like permease
LIGFDTLIAKKDAGVVTSITAMFPALTAVLSFIFLKEEVTPLKVVGIVLSCVAVFLLAL